jgi:glycerophosphoryl diester phosphodiesterase
MSLKILQETIQKGNKFYIVKQTEDESREIYLCRIQYIINMLEKNVHTENIVLMSLLWRNIKYFNMTYPIEIMKIINV